jgi:hypothetical protein
MAVPAAASFAAAVLSSLSAARTRSSRTVSWMARLARNWAVTSSGCLSRHAWTSSSSGSMGPGISLPVFLLIRAM